VLRTKRVRGSEGLDDQFLCVFDGYYKIESSTTNLGSLFLLLFWAEEVVELFISSNTF
jgi:hypothetical protein